MGGGACAGIYYGYWLDIHVSMHARSILQSASILAKLSTRYHDLGIISTTGIYTVRKMQSSQCTMI